jgi:hypothetical protein
MNPTEINQDDETRLTKQAERLREEVERLQIRDALDYERATAYSLSLRQYRKRIEEFFAPLKRSARATLDAILAREKAVTGPVALAERILDQRILAWQEEELARRKAEAATSPLASELPVLAEPETPQAAQGFTTRSQWKWEVTSLEALIAAAAADPRWVRLLRPNDAAITSLVNGLRDQTSVPGIRVYEVKVAVKRTGG